MSNSDKDQNKNSEIVLLIQKLDSKIDSVVLQLDSKIDRLESKIFLRLGTFISSVVVVAVLINAWLFDYKFDYTNDRNNARFGNLESVVYIKKEDISSDQLFKVMQELLQSYGGRIPDIKQYSGKIPYIPDNAGKSSNTKKQGGKSKGQKKKDNNQINKFPQQLKASSDEKTGPYELLRGDEKEKPVESFKKVSQPFREPESETGINKAGFTYK